jgi:serine/threonine protein kinase
MNLYSLLEVDPKARKEVVQAAYKALALEFKDDEKRLKAINGAKDVLLNEAKRTEYDGVRETIKKGKLVGEYRITEKIAEGGFGTTYKAEHIKLGMPVCIKHANNISKSDEELLIEEAKSIWDLRHYSIPAIRDILKLDDGSVALVMSYVEGPTIAQIMEKKKHLDPEHISWITSRVLNVLKYLHFHGVVHGDVKPQNIIVQPHSHQIVLVDYGLATIRPQSTSTNKGYTPIFAAPEQIEGKPLVPETDFYGLGTTMIYCLGGDVEQRRVPEHTPDAMCKFIKKLIPVEVLSRPNWKEDLCDTYATVREECFGRRESGMKKLDWGI